MRIDRSREAHVWGPARKAAIATAILALGLLVAVLLLRRPPTVAVAQVREARPGEAATEITAAGYVAAERRSTIAPKAAGRLEAVLVAEGEQVAQGQVVAQMDASDARIAVQHAEATVAAARASLAASEALAIQAQRTYERSQKLARGEAITDEALLDAQAARDTARAERRAARAHVEEALRGLAGAQLKLEDTVIKAPFSGTVERKLADEGAVLAPAAISETEVGGILQLVDLSSLYVEAEVSEEQLGGIKTGQPALVFLDAFPEQIFPARAGTVRPAIDRSKATAVVRVELLESTAGPLPDMGAQVAFLSEPLGADEARTEARLRVPASAVVERDGKPVVLTVQDGRLQAVPVEIARRVGTEVVLAKGPKPGTQVVAAPGSRLRAGSRVRVKLEAS